MPLSKSKPVLWSPKGCVDSVDGTTSPKGSMTLLTNLVQDPTTARMFVPRAASINLTKFGSFDLPTGATAALVVGDICYGMVSSSHFADNDEPFVYNLASNAFIAVSGATAANTPATQPTTGDWTPPTMEVIGGRIMVTHPGFGGVSTGYYLGWFDISGFNDVTTGNVTTGSPVIDGFPNIDGVTPGMTVSGTAIPANTIVDSFSNVVLAPTGTTHGNTTVDSISSMTGIAVGQQIEGAGIAEGTTITVVNVGGSSITLSQAATASASGVTLNITGTTITMSANATGTHTGEAITIAGGTPGDPLWVAGNTSGFPLPSVPTFVKNFNNRAYYACGNMNYYSDVLVPTNMTNAGQALTVGDTTPITSMGTLPFNTLSGGVVQALVVFKDDDLFQIQGDAALSNLTLNDMDVGVGTAAPLSVVSTPNGLSFIANDGLRFVGLTGNVTQPTGEDGQGISYPFISALHPSRISACYNADTLRISVQNGAAPQSPFQDWWLNMTTNAWSGPHTFPSNICQRWRNTFVTVPQSAPAGLWQSNSIPNVEDTYTENGIALSWDYQTVLLPDNELMAVNSIIESSIGFGLYISGQSLTFVALNEGGQVLDQVVINETGIATLWGGFVWGEANWGGVYLPYQQHRIPWSIPLVANQMSVQVNGFSAAGFKIGNLFLRYRPLGYMVLS